MSKLSCAVACAAVFFTAAASAAGTLAVAGDEWMLGNEAYASASGVATQRLVSNMAGLFGGTRYTIVSDDVANLTLADLSSLATQLRGLGKTVTTTTSFSAATLLGADAVLFAGRGTGTAPPAADVLDTYLRGGGSVWVALGTGAIGGPGQEAAAWNPLLGRFGLNAPGGDWLGPPSLWNMPVVAGGSALTTGVSSLLWGYGQAVGTGTAVAGVLTSVSRGDFSAYNGAGVTFGTLAVAQVVPEPASWALWLAGIGGLAAARRARVARR